MNNKFNLHCVSFLKLIIYLSIYFDERQKEISHLYIYHLNIVQLL